MKNYVVYKIKNLITESAYIGSTSNLEKRTYQHFQTLENNKHHNKHLQNSYNKYGKDAFSLSVIEYCSNREDMLEREQYFIDYFINSNIEILNLAVSVTSPNYGKLSDEHREKISLAHKNNPYWKGKNRRQRTKKKISSNNARYWRDKTYGKHPASKAILQIDINSGEIIAKFDSVKSARESIGKYSPNATNISKCLNGTLKSAYGFRWKYAD